jgi:small subunit ribosomal protein S19
MSRSAWKGPFCEDHLIKKAQKIKESGKLELIKTWSRRSTILPIFVGITFGVHNGKQFISVAVTEDMVGRKFGEFSPTRTFKGHGAGKKVSNKK